MSAASNIYLRIRDDGNGEHTLIYREAEAEPQSVHVPAAKPDRRPILRGCKSVLMQLWFLVYAWLVIRNPELPVAWKVAEIIAFDGGRRLLAWRSPR